MTDAISGAVSDYASPSLFHGPVGFGTAASINAAVKRILDLINVEQCDGSCLRTLAQSIELYSEPKEFPSTAEEARSFEPELDTPGKLILAIHTFCQELIHAPGGLETLEQLAVGGLADSDVEYFGANVLFAMSQQSNSEVANLSPDARATERDTDQQQAETVAEGPPDVPAAGVLSDDGNVLEKLKLCHGKCGWEIEGFGEHEGIGELLGGKYLAMLLQSPRTWVQSTELYGIECESEVKADSHSRQPRWDVDNKMKKLKEDDERIEAEIEEAKDQDDGDKYEKLLAELRAVTEQVQALRKQMNEAIGRHGRSRELNSPNRKVHDNVRKAIDVALEKLKDSPKLYRHLRDAIQPDGKGTAYGYDPGTPVAASVIPPDE